MYFLFFNFYFSSSPNTPTAPDVCLPSSWSSAKLLLILFLPPTPDLSYDIPVERGSRELQMERQSKYMIHCDHEEAEEDEQRMKKSATLEYEMSEFAYNLLGL